MILFLWFKLMMMMLLLVIFVVVVLELSVVIFWLQGSSWLCVCRFGRVCVVEMMLFFGC